MSEEVEKKIAWWNALPQSEKDRIKRKKEQREKRKEFGKVVIHFWSTNGNISLSDISEYLSTKSMLQGEFYEDYSAYVEELEAQLGKQKGNERVKTK